MAAKWCVALLCALAASAAAQYYRDSPTNRLGYDRDDVRGDEIQGEAGRDYPVYDRPPDTGFSCNDIQNPGYYADPQAGCQAYYVCRKSGRGAAFLCPNGTIFNQELLVCDWWYNFDCNLAESYYGVNEEVNRAMEDDGGYRYNRPNNVNTQSRPSSRFRPFGRPGFQRQNGYNRPQINGYSTRRQNQGRITEAYTPRPTYGPPDRQYLPPSSPDRTYLPPSSPGIQYGTPDPSRTYLPPSK